MSASDTNTSTRVFYTDPLAAAWMAKHFGMIFIEPETNTESEEIYCDPEWIVGNPWKIKNFIIHPDSTHLLNSEVSDIIQFGDFTGNVTAVGHDRVLVESRIGVTKATLIDSRNIRIIQRNGMAFIWPESEVA